MNYATTAAASFAVEVDGKVVSTFTPGSTSGASTATPQMVVNCAGDRMHSVRIVALTGAVTVHSVSVSASTLSAMAAPVRSKTVDTQSGVRLFPNPGSSTITLVIPDGGMTVEMTDMMGRIHRRESLTSKRKLLDVSNIPDGINIISVITSDGKRTSTRFMKE